MVDKTILASRFRKSVDTYDENATVQKVIAGRLFALIQPWMSGFSGSLLEIGCGTGLLTHKLCRAYPDNELFVNDLVEAMCSKTASRCALPPDHCLAGDIETLELPRHFALIASASTFQWLADPARTYARLAGSIQQGGILAFSSFGEDNLYELKALTGQGLRYISPAGQAGLLAPYFEILHQEESRQTLCFDRPLDVLRHLKQTGVNALGNSRPWSRKQLDEFSRLYTARFLTDGRYPLTYHPYYFICRKRS